MGRVTISHVAELAGVSPSTVSRVLNKTGYMRPEVRQRVEQAIKQSGYHPNDLARSLRLRQTQTLGLVLPDILNPFYAKLAQSIEEAADKAGYYVIFCHAAEQPDKESRYLKVLRARQVDGILIAPTGGNVEDTRSLSAEGVAIVELDRRSGNDLDAVLTDNVAGVREAVGYLLGLGHRRVGIITGPESKTTGLERLDGYRLALAIAGIPLDPALIRTTDFSAAQAHRHTLELLDLPEERRPTALFVANNTMGTGAMRALRERAIQVPRDLSFIVYDDVEWAELVQPRVTTVAQPAAEMGAMALDMLLRRIRPGAPASAPAVVRLEPTLILRESCAPPA